MTTTLAVVVASIAVSLLVLSYEPDASTWAISITPREPWWRPARTQRINNKRSGSSQPVLDPKVVGEAVRFAEVSSSRLARLENTLGGSNVRVVPGSPAHGALIASKPSSSEALSRYSKAQLALIASQYLAENNCRKFNLKEKKCGALVNSLSLTGTSLESSCTPVIAQCDKTSSRYRAIDGSCNNLKHPTWGSALTAYRRLVPPSYGDGLQSPRGGTSLPGAKQASVALVKADSPSNASNEPRSTLSTAIWAQLVSMDIAHTPVVIMVSTGNSIACCKPDGEPLPPRSRHPSCLPVIARPQDVERDGRRCLDLVRSLIAPRPDCRFGHAEQMNQATHWLDGSPLYGSSKATSQELREFRGGHLLLSNPGRLLSLSKEPSVACQNSEKSKSCFRAGDSRVNEQPLVTSMVTLLAREHNRIADNLSKLNPSWSDETLFQESRRIVLAEIQHITYNEWLPHIIGKTAARQVTNAQYSANTDPSVINSLAALPFTLSMLPTTLQLDGKSINDSYRLRHYYNRPAVITETGRLDDLVRTLSNQPSLPVDLLHTDEVTSGLYATNGKGLDAVSLAIQRGRDHGLPGYNTFRGACGMPTAKTFEDFADVMDTKVITELRKVYRKPSDVDLYIGALAERARDQTLLGPTLTCLLTKQLKDTRRADRHFYDIDKDGEFTTAQLAEIKKASLARIFCDNGDNILNTQPHVFTPANEAENSIVSCTQIPLVNLSAWKNQRVPR